MLPHPQLPAQAGGWSAAGDDSAAERVAAAGMHISVGGGDDAVVRIQLAARWAETFAPAQGDSLRGTLERFRRAYEYLDAVTHGVEPASLDGAEEPRQSGAH